MFIGRVGGSLFTVVLLVLLPAAMAGEGLLTYILDSLPTASAPWDLNYRIQVNNTDPRANNTMPSFEIKSGPTWVRKEGSTTVSFVYHEAVQGVDNFGSFNEDIFYWNDTLSGAHVFSYAIRSYTPLKHANRMLVFRQSFPAGLDALATGDIDSVVSSFPSLYLATTGTSDVGYIHFAGYMGGNEPQYGKWSANVNESWSLHGGIQASGMMCLFNEELQVSLVISPLTEFMGTSLAVDASHQYVSWGIMGNATRIPPGYTASWIMYASNGGVNQAVRRWGAAMQSYYGKKPGAAIARDLTLEYMGYSTDNGAYYYYYTDNFDNYEEVVKAVKDYSVKVGLPYRYMQLDSWWYYRQDDTDKTGVPLSGVTNWTAQLSIFPSGLKKAHEKTEWPIQAHNRYWATNNVYASNPTMPIGPTNYTGKTFPFVWGDTAGLPATFEFWDYFFSINEDWGLTVYEQDWLSLVTSAVPELTQNVTFGRQWLLQMGQAAEAHGVSIQYCMSFPRHVFVSLELNAVTQVRASNDYQPQSVLLDYFQWRIGESSLWLESIGVQPSKDSYWSMPTSQYTPHYDPLFNTTERRNRLESLVSSLANGPVQISDRVNDSDVSLIMRCCNAAGKILRPDVTAGPVDTQYLQAAFGHGGANGAAIHATWSTFSTHGNVFPYFYVMSALLQAPYDLPVTSILNQYPGLGDDGSAVPDTYLAFEANSSNTIQRIQTNAVLPLNTSDEYSFQYFTLIPVVAQDAWLLQGEVDKWISASGSRFENYQVVGGSEMTMVTSVEVIGGSEGEVVKVSFVHSVTLDVITVPCVMTPSLRAKASVKVNEAFCVAI